MKAVTLRYTDSTRGQLVEHRCGKDAGYECPGTRSAHDIADDWPLVRIWGDQGTFWVPMENLVSLSFQEKLEKCPVCS